MVVEEDYSVVLSMGRIYVNCEPDICFANRGNEVMGKLCCFSWFCTEKRN